MIFTSAMRCALPTYITRLLQERPELQSLASELTTIHSAINHADKSVSSLLTRARLWDTSRGEESTATGLAKKGLVCFFFKLLRQGEKGVGKEKLDRNGAAKAAHGE